MYTRPSIQVGHQIVSRLFDHRQFTDGEINFLIKGMSPNAGMANLDKILKINETSCVITDFCSSESGRLDSKPCRDIRDKVNELVRRSERILKIEEDSSLNEKANQLTMKQKRDNVKQGKYQAFGEEDDIGS